LLLCSILVMLLLYVLNLKDKKDAKLVIYADLVNRFGF